MLGGDLLDVELARGLFAIDRAATIARALQGHTDNANVARALAVREAIQGVTKLPPLREHGENLEDAQERHRQEAAFLLEAGLSLSTREMAALACVDRTTIMRRAHRLGGKIWGKYKSARYQGEPVRFSPAEVEAILQAGDIP